MSGWHPELHDNVVRLSDGDRHIDFHLVWLRDELGASTSPESLAVDELRVDDSVLRVRWRADNKLSRFPIAWLISHAYAPGRAAFRRPPSDVSPLEINANGSLASVIPQALVTVAHHGAAVLRRETRDPSADLAVLTDSLVDASFVTRADVPLTGAPLAIPPELPETAHGVTHYQLLHVTDAPRGDLLLADTHAVIAYLASVDADAARRVLAIPPRAHTRPSVPFPETEAWFRARDRYVALLRDPRHHIRVRVNAGDIVIRDRHRVLLGHTGIAPDSIHTTRLTRQGDSHV